MKFGSTVRSTVRGTVGGTVRSTVRGTVRDTDRDTVRDTVGGTVRGTVRGKAKVRGIPPHTGRNPSFPQGLRSVRIRLGMPEIVLASGTRGDMPWGMGR